jgi:cell division protein ZapA
VPARSGIPVRILGKEYRIRSDSDPELVARAARLVDDTVRKVRGRSSTVDSLDVAMLAALNLANQVLALRDGGASGRAGSAVDAGRLDALVALVASALDEPAPTPH